MKEAMSSMPSRYPSRVDRVGRTAAYPAGPMEPDVTLETLSRLWRRAPADRGCDAPVRRSVCRLLEPIRRSGRDPAARAPAPTRHRRVHGPAPRCPRAAVHPVGAAPTSSRSASCSSTTSQQTACPRSCSVSWTGHRPGDGWTRRSRTATPRSAMWSRPPSETRPPLRSTPTSVGSGTLGRRTTRPSKDGLAWPGPSTRDAWRRPVDCTWTYGGHDGRMVALPDGRAGADIGR